MAGWSCAFALSAMASLTPVSSQTAAAPAATNSPAALGPVVEVGEPANGYVGRLTMMPSHAPAGTPVTATVTGLPPGQEFQLLWTTVTGAWKVTDYEYKGREFTPVAYRIATVRADESGRLAVTFTAPDDYGFMHDIVLQQGSRLFTQTAFNLDMTVEISPKSGPPGTPITFDVKGIGFRSLYNSWDVIYDNGLAGWMSSVTTGGAARFTIPATGGPGVHIIEIMHGELTFPVAVHRHRRRAGDAGGAGRAGAEQRPPIAAAGRTGGDAGLRRRRRASRGARGRTHAGQQLQAELEPRGRQPHDRPGLGGKLHSRGGKQGGQRRAGRIPLRDAR
jgi:hypothetical protein